MEYTENFPTHLEGFMAVFNKWANTNIHQFGSTNTPFDLQTEAPIILESYVRRIIKYSECEILTAIYSLALLEKFCHKTGILISALNKHYLLFIALMTSLKFLEDNIFTLKDFSLISGISIRVLIKLEISFLKSIDFDLNIKYSSLNELILLNVP